MPRAVAPDTMIRGDESILTAIWRFAGYGGAIHVDVHFLRIVSPAPGDDPRELALETHGAMEAVFRNGGQYVSGLPDL